MAEKPEKGHNIRGYKLISRIGAGSYGEVWKATHAFGGSKFVVKLMYPYINRKFAIAEGRKLKKVVSQNVVKVFDAGFSQQHKRAYIVMELVAKSLEGELKKRKLRGRWLKLDEAYELLLGCIKGITEGHRDGIVHGDIKPANVLLDKRTPKLTDFGAARTLAGEDELAVRGSGTWAAPETLPPFEKSPDKDSDFFSLGIMGYMLLTETHPFFCNDPSCLSTEEDNIRKHDTFPITPIHEHRLGRGVDSKVAEYLMQLLQAEPAKRQEALDKLTTRLRELVDPPPSAPSAALPPIINCPHCGKSVTQTTYCGECGQLLSTRGVGTDENTRVQITTAFEAAKFSFFINFRPVDALDKLTELFSIFEPPSNTSPQELADCYSLKAYIHNSGGYYPDAIEAASFGLKIDSRHVNSLHARAYAYYKLRNFTRARDDLTLASTLPMDEKKRRQIEGLLAEVKLRL